MRKALARHFNLGTAIAVAALVFAMAGGAFAASGGGGSDSPQGSASATKKGPPGPRGKTGKTGKTGPQGPAGPQGAAGAQGPKGDTGGQGIQGIQGEKGKEGQEGKEGSPWTVGGVLPAEATETGTWSMVAKGEGSTGLAAIGFPIPLASPPAVVLVPYESASAPGCPGHTANGTPIADPGKLCVYTASAQGTITTPEEFPPYLNPTKKDPEQGVTPSGLILSVGCFSGECFRWGTWAVTAPAAP